MSCKMFLKKIVYSAKAKARHTRKTGRAALKMRTGKFPVNGRD